MGRLSRRVPHSGTYTDSNGIEKPAKIEYLVGKGWCVKSEEGRPIRNECFAKLTDICGFRLEKKQPKNEDTAVA